MENKHLRLKIIDELMKHPNVVAVEVKEDKGVVIVYIDDYLAMNNLPQEIYGYRVIFDISQVPKADFFLM